MKIKRKNEKSKKEKENKIKNEKECMNKNIKKLKYQQNIEQKN